MLFAMQISGSDLYEETHDDLAIRNTSGASVLSGNYRIAELLCFGEIEEVSSAMVMLVRNGYITGQTINVNVGWYIS